MRNITFDFLGQHRHGTAFHGFLKLRKSFFVDELGWDIPHDDDVEMDQYDNPLAHYSLVLRGGAVVGGARCMPTTAHWGAHTYMLRDALRGSLRDIPPEVMPADIESPDVWECTRLVISNEVTGHAERSTCLSLIVAGLVEIARAQGAEALVSLSPLPLMRGLRQLGYDANRLGEPYLNTGDGRKYAVLQMPAVHAPYRMLAAAE
ncbi:MAG: autoinducer synthase [Rhodovulum sulfidophilum]|uniref:Acyl-homoserine-lactone synthase n=1 Tax=Rhodovulum sulfidophilum TaxID=35806 RepID=A0A2W5NG33_RHOSU|nr:MAG: autoinducer synthase [Rhodovulum sulfidophilum]